MSILIPKVSDFRPISLDEMNGVRLMSRFDTKFVLGINTLTDLLERIEPFYRILEINNNRIHDYKSIYYDTDERKFYFEHHNNRVNRNKIRFREYVESGLTFLEIKLKNNKGKTIKKRIKVDKILASLTTEHKDYINKIIGHPLEVKAKQWIIFSRITLVHIEQNERITIDTNLTFKDEDNQGDLKDIVIAEVKQERISRKSDFIRIAKEMSILPIRLSKYCISTIKLKPNIKQNRFKKKLLYINKLKQE